MVRASFDEACRNKGMEPTDELFEEAIKNDAYFQQKMKKLEEKHVKNVHKPIKRAVSLATKHILH